jgi:hypothetical protein
MPCFFLSLAKIHRTERPVGMNQMNKPLFLLQNPVKLNLYLGFKKQNLVETALTFQGQVCMKYCQFQNLISPDSRCI